MCALLIMTRYSLPECKGTDKKEKGVGFYSLFLSVFELIFSEFFRPLFWSVIYI